MFYTPLPHFRVVSAETPAPGLTARLRSLWQSSHAPDVRAARLVLDVAAVGLIVAGLGLAWDGSWHFTLPFDEFWSPPHRVLYAGVALAAATNLGTFLPRVRSAFGGPAIRVPALSFEVPVPLVLLAAGSLMMLMGGMVDSRWHEILQGSEGHYSIPHNVTIIGGIIMGLAMASGFRHIKRPLPWVEKWGSPVLMAFIIAIFYRLVFTFTIPAAGLEGYVRDPVLATNTAAVALRQSYLDQGLVADNTLWAPLALAAAGLTPVVMASRLTKSRWGATVAAGLFTGALLLVALSSNARGLRFPMSSPAVFMVLPAALLADGLGPRLRGATWPLAGLVFGAGHTLVYGFNPAGLALAVAGGWAASQFGGFLARLMGEPTRREVGLGLLFLAIVAPIAIGMIDAFTPYGRALFGL